MQLRIVRGQAQPGPASELARRWKEFFVPLRDGTGVRRVIFAGDRGANTTIAIIDWALMGPLTLAFLGRPLRPEA